MRIDRQVETCHEQAAAGRLGTLSMMEACLRMRDSLLRGGDNRGSSIFTPPSQTRYDSRRPKHASRLGVYLPGSHFGRFIRVIHVGRSRSAEVLPVGIYRQAHPHEPPRRAKAECMLDYGD
jgi:hypothetical protein